MRRTATLLIALLLAACSSPRLDDAELMSVSQATPDDLARLAQAQQTHPYFKKLPEELRVDWPVLRIVFRSSRDLIEDGPLSQTTAHLCGQSFETGYIGSNQLLWGGQFLTDKLGASLRSALRQSLKEEFELFIPYTYRDNRSIPSSAQTVTVLPLPTDLCLSRNGAYYSASAGPALRIDKTKIIDALNPLPRTLTVQQ